jgi:hypothetical protein
MKKWVAIVLVLIAGVVWWTAAAPRPEIQIAESIFIDPSTRKAIEAVDDSAGFATQLEVFHPRRCTKAPRCRRSHRPCRDRPVFI